MGHVSCDGTYNGIVIGTSVSSPMGKVPPRAGNGLSFGEEKKYMVMVFIICLTIIVYYFSTKVNDLVITFCDWSVENVIC